MCCATTLLQSCTSKTVVYKNGIPVKTFQYGLLESEWQKVLPLELQAKYIGHTTTATVITPAEMTQVKTICWDFEIDEKSASFALEPRERNPWFSFSTDVL